MKKLSVTLPSTQPDHLYSSQPSQTSLTSSGGSYQSRLSELLSSLRSIHSLRYYLLFRDIQSVFSTHHSILTDLLGATSPDSLWRLLAGQGQQQLREQQQIALLLRILLELNTRKHAEADRGNINSFDQYRIAIEWLIPQIVSFQAQIRLKLQEKLIKTCQAERQKRESQFRRYDHKMRQHFQTMEAVRQENLADRLQRQTQAKNAEVLLKIQKDMHKIRASSQLRDAKETALLRKLAPYRWEKKRPYEDETYRQELEQTIDLDQTRRKKAIQQMKRVQKERLKREHATLVATQDMRAQTMRERLHSQLEHQGTALRGHEEQALRNLRHSVDMANTHRVASLRKSLQAFTRHQDTLKIKQILQDHHTKVQFCNTIEQVVMPQTHAAMHPAQYTTIQSDHITGKAIDRHQRRLKKRVNALLGPTEDGSSSGRKSLVQLYDKSLNLLHP